jgi:hypothetical protein
MIVATIAREESSTTRPRITSALESWAWSAPAVAEAQNAPSAIARPNPRWKRPYPRCNRRNRLLVEAIPASIRVEMMVVSPHDTRSQEFGPTIPQTLDTAAQKKVGDFSFLKTDSDRTRGDPTKLSAGPPGRLGKPWIPSCGASQLVTLTARIESCICIYPNRSRSLGWSLFSKRTFPDSGKQSRVYHARKNSVWHEHQHGIERRAYSEKLRC